MSMGMGAAAGYVAAGIGGMALMNALNTKNADAPPGIQASANANTKIGSDALDWYKQIDAEGATARDTATQTALANAKATQDVATKQFATGQDTTDFANSTFRPIQSKIASDALNYDTQARRDQEASLAQADVGTADDASRESLSRDILSRGGDVNSGNYQAALAGNAVRMSAAKAAAGNLARKQVEATGAQRMTDAANLGNTVTAAGNQNTALGLNATGVSDASVAMPSALTAQRAATMGQGVQLATGANTSAGNLLLGQYQGQVSQENSSDALTGSLGGAAGGILAAKSDMKLKKNRKSFSGKVAMSQVRATPVDSWKYNKGAGVNDGGQTHVGPMAQDVQQNMGDKTAPGGKVIDLISMSGKTLAAVKEIDRRLVKLEHAKRRQLA